MNQLKYRNFTDDDKRQICGWNYAEEYKLYNLPPYDVMKVQQQGFMNSKHKKNYFAFLDGDVLVGLVDILERDTEIFIGIGVKPCALWETLWP